MNIIFEIPSNDKVANDVGRFFYYKIREYHDGGEAIKAKVLMDIWIDKMMEDYPRISMITVKWHEDVRFRNNLRNALDKKNIRVLFFHV